MTKRLHIIYWKNGKGLELDADILAGIAESAGYQVSFSETRQPGHYGTLWKDHVSTRWHNWMLHRRLVRQAVRAFSRDRRLPYDVAICIEDFYPAALRIARKIALVPNQEWFRKSDLPKAARADVVVCKSRLAERIFHAAGARSRYTGFSTLVDSEANGETPDYSRCLHVAGRSFMKGSPAVIEAWRRHPEWPPITVLGTGGHRFREIPGNVHLVERPLTERERIRLQATHGIHLCPSESEGYGHTIAEGMALGALVVTTDAPPMNELVGTDRGVLVRPCKREPKGLDHRYPVAAEAIEAAMAEVWAMPIAERAALGTEARRHFEESRAFFHSSLVEVLEELAAGTP